MKHISFKLIFRSWWRNKTFAIISILSLAVGIACTNLLAAFVIHEYNIEGDNPNKDRIVVVRRTLLNTGMNVFSIPAPVIIDQLLSHVPELDNSCQVRSFFSITYFKVGENYFTDMNVVEADTSFVRFFPQKVIKGSMEDALVGPDRIILTESFAQRLFGRNDPIGQVVQIHFSPFGRFVKQEGLLSYTVSAVVKDNRQSVNVFDAAFFSQIGRGTSYFMLKDNISIADLQAKTENLTLRDPSTGVEVKYTFFSMQEACLNPDAGLGVSLKKPNANLLWIAFFSAILILAIACFNYVNLSFSRVFKQLYSMHVQKLMGAGSRQLSMQLFADTFLTVGLGFLIAQLIQLDLLGVLNRIMSVQVPTSFLYSSQVLPATFGFILLLACIPALYMSRRLPEMSISMYNNFYRGTARRRIIATLAVLQFAISFVLIIGSLTLRQQLSLLSDKFEKCKDIYLFSIGSTGRNTQSLRPLKERIIHFPGIQAVTLSNYTGETHLGDYADGDIYYSEDGDEDVMEVMGYTLLQGLPWKEALARYPHPVYLNRTWAQILFPDGNIPWGWPITEYEPKIKVSSKFNTNNYVIAGVVEDYCRYYTPNSLEAPIGKVVIRYSREGIFLIARIAPESRSAIRQIYEEWDKLYPGEYLEHESVYDKVLDNNKKLFEMSDLLMMYSIISILLTCFGLFGMSLYAIEQRTKEIGIRKVNGSTTWQVMRLLNRQFIGWIGIAYVIAVPVAWWLLNQWMQNFVFRADFSIWTYILSLLIVVAITLLTVSWHSYKAASGNPVNALRDE